MIFLLCQVAAGCVYPRILQGDALPPDARLRAQKLLSYFDGGSIGKDSVCLWKIVSAYINFILMYIVFFFFLIGASI